jgi:branched-chain amino acid transport system ATP-binding protein
MPLLKLDGVRVRYGYVEALKGISLFIEEGEIVALIGANGAGKSTTLRAICGLVPISEGRMEFDGRRIDGLPPHRIVRLGISQVPEGRRIFPRLTVLENLMMGAYFRKDRDRVKEDLDFVFSLFPILAQRRNQKGGTLSGGEQQMLAIGRALMARPRMLLLDEPSLGLAPNLVLRTFDAIKRINEAGVTIFLVEQNAYMALEISNRGYVIENGRIILSDFSENLMGNEFVKRAYLGEGPEVRPQRTA